MGAAECCGFGQPSYGQKLCRDILNNTYLNYIKIEHFDQYLIVLQKDVEAILKKEINSLVVFQKIKDLCAEFCLTLILGKIAKDDLKEKFENNKFKDIHALLIPDFDLIPDLDSNYLSYIYCWAFSFLKPNVILTKHESLFKHIVKQYNKVDLNNTRQFINMYITYNVEYFPIKIIKFISDKFDKHERNSRTHKDLIMFEKYVINQDVVDDLNSKLRSFSNIHAYTLNEKLLADHEECIIENNNTQDINSFSSFEDYLMIDNVIVWCFNEYLDNIGRVANTNTVLI